MKNNAIMFVILVMFIPCLLQAKWITLIPGFNDSTATFEVTHSDDDSTIVEIEIPGVWADSIYDGTSNKTYWSFNPYELDFAPWGDSLGKPTFKYKNGCLFAPDSGGYSITISQTEDSILSGYHIIPCSWGDSIGVFDEDSATYNDTIWLNTDTIISDTATWRGTHLVRFAFNLYSYKPSGDTIKINRKVRVKFTFDNNYDTLFVEPYIEETYSSIFMDYSSRTRAYYTDTDPLIIYLYQDGWESKADSLAKFRYKQGYKVKTVGISEIEDIPYYSAMDCTTAVREFIQDTMEAYMPDSPSPLMYVGIISQDDYSWDKIPCHYRSGEETDWPYSIPSDNIPQVFIGRILAYGYTYSSPTTQYIKNIIKHETTLVETDNKEKCLVISGSDGWGYPEEQRKEWLIRSEYLPSDIEHLTCYVDITTGTNPVGTSCAWTSSINDELFGTDGYSSVWYVGHGSSNVWWKCYGLLSPGFCATEGGYSWNDWITDDLKFTYPSVIVSDACQTGDAFGQNFTAHGALGFFGHTASNPNGNMGHHFMHYLARSNTGKLGEAWLVATMGWFWDYDDGSGVGELMLASCSPYDRLIGDPLSRVFVDIVPDSLNISLDCITYADGNFTVTLSSVYGGSVSGAKVCLTSGLVEDDVPICNTDLPPKKRTVS